MKYLLISMLVSMLTTTLLSDPKNIHYVEAEAHATISQLAHVFKG